MAAESDIFAPADALLADLLAVSLTAIHIVSPIYGPAGELADFAINYLNPAGQRMTGLPERPNGTVLSLFPHTVAAGIFDYFCGVFKSEQTGDYEANYQVDGVGGYRLFAARRSGERLLVSYTDTTDQPRNIAEQTLRTSQAQERTARAQDETQRQAQERALLYQVFEETPALICILRGPEHRFAYFNAAHQRQFPRPLAGRSVAEVLPEAEAQGFTAMLDTVYRTGETYFGQELLLTMGPTADAPPEPAYFNMTCQAYRENGQTLGVCVFAYVVTEQVQARQARETQQRQLAELFEQAPVAIAVFRGPRYIIEVANPAVCALWGRTPAQALHMPLFELLTEAAGQGFEELLDEVMATGIPYVANELPSFINRNGQREIVYWNFVYQPLREADGLIVGVTVVATDVTDQVRTRRVVEAAEEQARALADKLAATNAQLTRTNADLDTFIYTASHDLRAPIANIEGLLELLRRELPPNALQARLVPAVLDRMQHAVDRFMRTIAQLTDLTRLQQSQTQPAESVDLVALIEAICLDLAPQLSAAQVELTLDLVGCPAVSFAPQHLRSIIFNLLSNAIKYRHPERAARVWLRSLVADSHIVLEVADNGLGLNDGQQAQLFGMFQRLHDHVEGSGLGLYMVKKIVENAGGTITVQSVPDVGSTFTVRLPA